MKIMYLPLALSVAAILLGGISLLQTGSSRQTEILVPSQGEQPFLGISISLDIEGQVAHPGLVQLESPAGKPARVADAIQAAGGFLPEADRGYIEKNINLAALVTDGMKLYIPKTGEQATSSTSTVVHINTATLYQLETLKNIGATRAKTIFDNRPYMSYEELVTKTKLPSGLLDKIKHEIDFQ